MTHFGWEIQNNTSIPAMSKGYPVPLKLTDVIRCQCRAQSRSAGLKHVAITESISHAHPTVTVLAKKSASIPHTKRDVVSTENQRDAEMEDGHADDVEGSKDGEEREDCDRKKYNSLITLMMSRSKMGMNFSLLLY